MNRYSRRNINQNEPKDIASLFITGIIVTAGLLSGLFLIGGYQNPAVAQEQQNLTAPSSNSEVIGGSSNDTTTSTTGTAAQGGNTTNQSEIRLHLQEALSALRNNDTQGALMHLDIVLNTIGGGGVQGNTTTTSTTTGGNSIAGTADGNDNDSDGNDATEESSSSNTNTNTEGTSAEEDEEDSDCGGVTVGGTSAADDYGCPPDPDY